MVRVVEQVSSREHWYAASLLFEDAGSAQGGELSNPVRQTLR